MFRSDAAELLVAGAPAGLYQVLTSLPVTLESVCVESEEGTLGVTSAVSLTVISCGRYLII